MKALIVAVALLIPAAAQAADECFYQPVGPNGCLPIACKTGQYRSKDGTCVSRPHNVAAHCKDGYVSYAGGRGACRGHGGVWYWGKAAKP